MLRWGRGWPWFTPSPCKAANVPGFFHRTPNAAIAPSPRRPPDPTTTEARIRDSASDLQSSSEPRRGPLGTQNAPRGGLLGSTPQRKQGGDAREGQRKRQAVRPAVELPLLGSNQDSS